MMTLFVCAALAVYAAGGLWLWYGLRRASRAGGDARPFVSVVVAARNEETHLPPLLADLDAQTYDAFEVIVADDRSTDATAGVVERYAGRSPGRFRLVRQSEVPAGLSPKKMALQRAVAAARGELLLFTDADCRVRPTWVEGMTRCFEPGVAMVLGYSELTVTKDSTLFERVQAFEFQTLVATMAASANLGRAMGASGQNLAVRREVFDSFGGFSSVMHRVAGDDVLLLRLVRGRPGLGRVVYSDSPATRNRTYPESTWRAFRHQRARWASSGTHHFRSDRLFMAYALSALAVNMAVLFGWSWAWAGLTSWGLWAATVVLKLAVDLLFYGSALRRFGRTGLLACLPLWFVAQPVYLLLMAYWGRRGRWAWKPDGQRRLPALE